MLSLELITAAINRSDISALRSMIEQHGVDFFRFSHPHTPLYRAVYSDNLPVVNFIAYEASRQATMFKMTYCGVLNSNALWDLFAVKRAFRLAFINNRQESAAKILQYFPSDDYLRFSQKMISQAIQLGSHKSVAWLFDTDELDLYGKFAVFAEALEAGQPGMVLSLLDKVGEDQWQSRDFRSDIRRLCYSACRHNYPELLCAVIDKSHMAERDNPGFFKVFLYALGCRNESLIRMLVTRYRIILDDEFEHPELGMGPIQRFIASRSARVDVIKLLVELGLDLNKEVPIAMGLPALSEDGGVEGEPERINATIGQVLLGCSLVRDAYSVAKYLIETCRIDVRVGLAIPSNLKTYEVALIIHDRVIAGHARASYSWLAFAAYRGSVDVVGLLLRHGALVTPGIIMQNISNTAVVVEQLLRGYARQTGRAVPDFSQEEQQYIFSACIQQQNYEVLALLLEQKVLNLSLAWNPESGWEVVFKRNFSSMVAQVLLEHRIANPLDWRGEYFSLYSNDFASPLYSRLPRRPAEIIIGSRLPRRPAESSRLVESILPMVLVAGVPVVIDDRMIQVLRNEYDLDIASQFNHQPSGSPHLSLVGAQHILNRWLVHLAGFPERWRHSFSGWVCAFSLYIDRCRAEGVPMREWLQHIDRRRHFLGSKYAVALGKAVRFLVYRRTPEFMRRGLTANNRRIRQGLADLYNLSINRLPADTVEQECIGLIFNILDCAFPQEGLRDAAHFHAFYDCGEEVRAVMADSVLSEYLHRWRGGSGTDEIVANAARASSSAFLLRNLPPLRPLDVGCAPGAGEGAAGP